MHGGREGGPFLVLRDRAAVLYNRLFRGFVEVEADDLLSGVVNE